MLTIPHPEKLNGQMEIDDLGYDLHWVIENEDCYIFVIDQLLLKTSTAKPTDLMTYGLSIYRDYVTIDDMGVDIYNNIGIKKIVRIQLSHLQEKVVHMISLTDLKDLERFKRVVEGMIIGLNEKMDRILNPSFPPLNQWNGYNPISHSTLHGTW